MEQVLEVVLVLLASSVVAAIVASVFGKRSERLSRRHAALTEARDSLSALLKGYRQRAPAVDLLALEEDFLSSVDKASVKNLVQRAENFITAGRRWASRDPFLGLEDVEDARDEVRYLLTAKLKRLN